MPQLIKHIDAIARAKQRDVLFIRFHDARKMFDLDWTFPDTENLHVRKRIIAWLDENHIPWEPCADFASENTSVSYLGQIYMDVPFNPDDESYQLVERFLENPDGSMRFPGVFFVALELEAAMKNAHHDEPGFWEAWAEKF